MSVFISGAGGSGGGGNVAPYFVWNQTDLTQFDGTPAFQTGGWNTQLSVVADATTPGGNLLSIGSASGAGTGCGIILAAAALPAGVYNWIMRAEIQTVDPANAQYVGMAFYADDSGPDYYGYQMLTGLAGWKGRVDAGVLATDGASYATGISSTQIAEYEIEVVGDKAVGVAPRFSVRQQVVQTLGGVGNILFTQADFVAPTPAGWTSVTPNRWGLVIQASSGNPPMQYAYFRSLAILPHPLDY